MKKRSGSLSFSLFCLITLLVSCRNQWSQSFNKINGNLLYGNSHDNWELIQFDNHSPWDKKYTLKKVDGDTTKILFFFEDKNGVAEITEYKKLYPCGLDTCFLEMTGLDTLYFYKQQMSKRTFFIGEYAFLFSHFKMDTIDAAFYLKYEDSLRRIKGNNLPKLVPRD
jgi:hypothetical protein